MKILIILAACFIFPLFAQTDVPYSLTRLAEIKNKESEAYVFLAHQAAMDARLAATSALEGENSSSALKILGLALDLMPHRSDLKDLRNKTLETYLNITKKLEEDVEKNCELLKERYSFLNSFAPDAITKVAHDKRCIKKEKTQNAFKIPEPKLLKGLESEFKANTTHTTHNFPYVDVLNNSFMLFTSLLGENFKITCGQLKSIEGKIHGTCSASVETSSTYKEASLKYCSFLNELLIVPEGKRSVTCTIDGRNHIFQTSDDIYNVYVKAVDNAAFDDDIPVLVSMDMSLVKKDQTTIVPVLLRINQKDIKARKFPISSLEVAPEEYFFEQLSTETVFDIEASEARDLQEIIFTIDRKKTYEDYKSHYEAAIKQDLECQLMEKKLDELKPSREKKALKKTFAEKCPLGGNLKKKILETANKK